MLKKLLLRVYRSLKCRYFLNYVKKRVHYYGSDLYVNGKCSINGDVILGNNVNFNGMSVRGTGRVAIGDNFHSGIDCVILTSNHNYHGAKIPYDAVMINKEVLIEDNVWIGDHVLILGGAILREGCIIQAGSVVVGEIPMCAIAGGNPARVFKYRNKEHYEKCKKAKLFF